MDLGPDTAAPGWIEGFGSELDTIPAAFRDGGFKNAPVVVILRRDRNGVTFVKDRLALAGAASAFFVVTSNLRSIENALKGGGGGGGEGAAEGFVEREIDDFEMFFKEVVRDLLGLGDGAETIWRGVLGEEINEREVDTEEIVDGVLVFDLVKTAGANAAFCFAVDLGKFMESSFEVTEELDSLFFIELFLGWHLVVLNAIEDIAPAGERGAFRGIELECLEIELAFFIKGVMALVAIIIEELDDGGSELILWVLLCSEGSEKEKRESEEAIHEPFFKSNLIRS
jgi:hypothetical protein